MSTILEQLARELAASQKHATPAGSHQGPMVAGTGGLFGHGCAERDIISSRMQPSGLASMLPTDPTIYDYPLYEYVTGFTAPVGNQGGAACDDGPVAGAMKACTQTAQLGVYKFMTRELDISKVGHASCRSEMFDHRVLNDPLVEQLAGIFPTLPNQDAIMAGREVLARILMVGVAFQDELARQLYVGSGAGNEFAGLEMLVSSTKWDARTGKDCPSLASDIRNMNYACLGSVGGGDAVVRTITSMWRNLNNNASKMNFGQTRWVIVMRTQLFHEITDIWPCMYMSQGCMSPSPNVTFSVDTGDQINLRDSMRNEKYLIIDGQRVQVVTDDALEEEVVGNGRFASDIYILPLTVRGGVQVLYWEYFDYSRGTNQAIRDGNLQSDFWTDDGRYLWHKKPPKNWCVQWISKIEPRLILLTPHLAGRIQSICYSPDKHFRDVYPDQPYYVNGGVTDGYSAPSYYDFASPPSWVTP